jgi:plastocyanin
MANGMMTIIAYDGAMPTGPAAAYFDLVTGSLTSDPDVAHPMPPVLDPEASDAPPLGAPPSHPATDHPTADEQEVVIAMLDDRFEPNAVEVAAGTTITWVNEGTNWHSVAAYDGSFESPKLATGESYSTRLDEPGLYQYICKHHGLQGMLGRVTVS